MPLQEAGEVAEAEGTELTSQSGDATASEEDECASTSAEESLDDDRTELLLVGGEGMCGWVNTVEAWILEDGDNPSSKTVGQDAWCTSTSSHVKSWQPLPCYRSGFAWAAAAGRLYLLGGTDDEDVEVASVEVFDVAAGIWLRGTPAMLLPRTGGMAAAVTEDVLLVAGGNGGDELGYLAATELLCLGARTPWQELTPMHSQRADAAVTSCDGLLYVAGGRDGGEVLCGVESFNLERCSWDLLPPMGTPRARCSAAVIHGALLVTGGFNDSFYLSTTERFHPESRTWEALVPMLTSRCAAGIAVISGAVYVFGGCRSGEILTEVERFDPISCTWAECKPLANARAACGIGVISGLVDAGNG